MKETKKCLVCGNALSRKQLKYCSKKCMGLGKQGYKICIVCGKKFPEWEKSQKVCCSAECSKNHREQMHQDGTYTDSVSAMRQGFCDKVKEIGPEGFWGAKGWIIQSPSGHVYECRNLLNFIRENPDLFDGTEKQAYDGFQKIKSTMQGKRKKCPSKSWKGWTLINWSE